MPCSFYGVYSIDFILRITIISFIMEGRININKYIDKLTNEYVDKGNVVSYNIIKEIRYNNTILERGVDNA